MQSKSTSRLVVISNRGAYTIVESNGNLFPKRAVSGLVSAVEPVLNIKGGTWVSWCGRLGNGKNGKEYKLPVSIGSPHYTIKEIVLSEAEYNDYYQGFSNSCLWPLAHQMIDKCVFERSYWKAYRSVNHKFAQATLKVTREEDILWAHDYHLALIPQLIRRRYPLIRLAFFWHIPFPPSDVFQMLPWGRQILHGLLGSSLLVFHTKSYMQNFLTCVKKYFQVKINQEQGIIRLQDRRILVRALPVGINWQHYEQLANDPEVKTKARQIRQSIGADYLLLGIDRLDYTKGIPERIKALGVFLEKYPHYRGKVTLLQIAVPSREGINAYSRLKDDVERIVGEINGLYDYNYGAVPVRYIHRSLNQKELVAHYLAADTILVTALKDGLNLIAKEFIASRIDGHGVLLLSPFTGAAEELKGALLANPYDTVHMAKKIKLALEMPSEEQKKRLEILQQSVKNKDVNWWWQTHLKLINGLHSCQKPEISSTRIAGFFNL